MKDKKNKLLLLKFKNKKDSNLRNVYILFLQNCKLFILALLKKKKRYDFNFDNSKVTNVYLKNTLVNTYLSMTINNKIVFAKSSGLVGFQKKKRRVKAAAYKLGKDLSSLLQSLIYQNKIGYFNINLVGYSRYYRAVVSSLRKTIRYALKTKKISSSALDWKNKLKQWRLRIKLIEYFFKRKFKINKTQLDYEKHLESQLKKTAGIVFFLKKIYDRTSPSHGLMRKSKTYYNNRYW